MTMQKILAIIVSCIVPVAVMIGLLISFLINSIPSGDYPKITFKQFITIYKIAPYNWMLYDNYVRYNVRRYTIKTIEFATILDCLKYKHWRKNKIKNDKKEANAKDILEMAQCWQEDIDKARKENIEHLKELMRENDREASKNYDNMIKRYKNEA